MQITTIQLPDLFTQLGLPNSDLAIARFIKTHQPLAQDVSLADAEFWSDAQRAFLREGWQQDSDWCVAIDKLDALLRHA